jgi:hypothetical protein
MPGDHPHESSATAGSQPQCGAGLGCVLAVLFGALGAIAGVLCYLAMAIAIETYVVPSLRAPDAPVLSYGAVAVLVIAPLMGALGALLAVAMFLIWIRIPHAAIILCVISSLGGLMIAGGLWSYDLNHYGSDPSALPLYVPVAILCLLLLLIAMIVGVSCACRGPALKEIVTPTKSVGGERVTATMGEKEKGKEKG